MKITKWIIIFSVLLQATYMSADPAEPKGKVSELRKKFETSNKMTPEERWAQQEEEFNKLMKAYKKLGKEFQKFLGDFESAREARKYRPVD